MMSGSAEAPPRIKLNVSQAGSPADETREIPHLHSPAPGRGDPGPERQNPGTQGETEGVRETETERREGSREVAQKVGGVPGTVVE